MQDILRHLHAWGRGDTEGAGSANSGAGRTVLLDSVDSLETVFVSGLVDDGTMVFAPPGDARESASVGCLVRYEGSLTASGDEMSVGEDFFVEAQDYAVTPFLAVAGPTLVRVSSQVDFDVFLQDADRAREQGDFVPALVHPMIQLGDLCALGGAHGCAGPRGRITVDASGRVRTSPNGMLLGEVRDGLDALDARWSAVERPAGSGCPVCLGGAVQATAMVTAHRERPWLSRYLHAVDAMRMAAARGLPNVRPSGFAHRLTPGCEGHEDAADMRCGAAAAPLVLFDDERAVLHDPVAGRQFRLARQAAQLVELLVVHADHDAAADAATACLGLDRPQALRALGELGRRLADAGMALPSVSDHPAPATA
ncbi:daptide biosynthesis RiPP recognition protein [Streptomyces xanthochromogenes]|uniref:daptide biosynthesis RiPP recognition protein n=1 Tax=Streptomyces xanthochromogenes TaxID=67384 RepID=UPI00381A9EC7